MTGRKRPAAARAAIAAGVKRYYKRSGHGGHSMSVKAKIAAGHRGKRLSPAHREAIRIGLRGRVQSERQVFRRIAAQIRL